MGEVIDITPRIAARNVRHYTVCTLVNAINAVNPFPIDQRYANHTAMYVKVHATHYWGMLREKMFQASYSLAPFLPR